MMDAGGSPFPYNDGASMDGGTMVIVIMSAESSGKGMTETL